jgi:SAM-dependent methyltransferase
VIADAARTEAIWHEVECGGYRADLAVWEQVARDAGGPVLELGAGTGRVALELAAAGCAVTALDSAPVLLDRLRERATARRVSVETVCVDARDLDRLQGNFAAVLAPMQFLHLLAGSDDRAAVLSATARRLRPGGVLAAAILAPSAAAVAPSPGAQMLPDVREVDGWVYSSRPLEIAAVGNGLEIRRLRQRVSPGGELTEERDSIHLATLSADGLEAEAAHAGLAACERIDIPETEEHVGSTVCVLEAR